MRLHQGLSCGVLVAGLLLTLSAYSQADITAFADVPPQAGAEVFTVDPAPARGEADTSAGRGVAADRVLYQSFKNPVDFDVRSIWLSQDVDNGDAGYVMSFYEVDDVLAGPLVLGDLVKTLAIPAGPRFDSYQC